MARVSPVYMERGDSTPAGYAQTPVAHLLQGVSSVTVKTIARG